VAVDPTGQFAYVTNNSDNTVSSFQITTSGALSQLGAAVKTGAGPGEIAVDPSGQYAFVADFGDGTIYEYTIEAGSLTSNGSTTCPSPFGLSAVTVDPTGQYAYVTSPATMPVEPGNPASGAVVCAYSIDPQQGTLTAIGSPLPLETQAIPYANPFSITIDPTGQFAYAADKTYGVIWEFTIDEASGLLTLNIPAYPTTPPTMLALLSISANPAPSFSSEYVYAANGVSGLSVLSCQITYAPAQTAGNAGNLLPPCKLQPHVPNSMSYPETLVVDPSGRFVYVDDLNSNNIWQYSVGAGGSLTLVTPASVSTGQTRIGMAVAGVVQ
jgi:6-phosphogluconolactonase (cycloisomerase 2 family)